MQPPPEGEITQILGQLSQGDTRSTDRLLQLVYTELRALAGSYLNHERSDHTLQPTALVHEAYIKLVGQTRVSWAGRDHFFAVAAELIRRILVDHARRQKALKRGGDWKRVTVTDLVPESNSGEVDLLALDDALCRLNEFDERKARVVELRFFGGLTVPQVAQVLSVSDTTIEGDWRVARAWLRRELTETPPEED